MRRESVKNNLILQLIYQITVFAIPLIISPYLTRTLGETALGEYTFANTVAYYFTLICMLGITKHGQRAIATVRHNDEALRKNFWALFVLHFLSSVVGLILYLVGCIFLVRENYVIYYAQAIYIFSALFDITWLFYGIERFRTVVFRSMLIKITELVLIFTFVKDSSDLIQYTLIMMISMFVSQFALFLMALKLVKPIEISFADMKEHMKPLLVLSISVFAISLYTIFDKILLGFMLSKESVAYYEYSSKIINVPKMIITVIGTVLFPRACNCLANKDYQQADKYFKYSINAVYFIGFASMFGLFGIAELFAKLYYGESFVICGKVIKSLSPVVCIIGVGDIFRMLYVIPMKKDIEYIICVSLNAVLNLILSVILIPIVGIQGAVIGTICAELLGMILQFILVRKNVDVKYTILNTIPFLVVGIIMWRTIEAFKLVNNSNWGALLLQIVLGGMVYTVLLGIWFFLVSPEKEQYRTLIRRKH